MKTKNASRKPNKLDWLVYNLFRARWNPIFANDDNMREAFGNLYLGWDNKDIQELVLSIEREKTYPIQVSERLPNFGIRVFVFVNDDMRGGWWTIGSLAQLDGRNVWCVLNYFHNPCLDETYSFGSITRWLSLPPQEERI